MSQQHQSSKTTYPMVAEGMTNKLSSLSPDDLKHFQKTMPTKKPLPSSVEEMDKNNVPLYLRDRCVHRVIPLNNCRHENLYMPWKCEEEKLRYERCQFKQFLKHVRRSQRLWKKEEKLKLIQQQVNLIKSSPEYIQQQQQQQQQQDEE